MESPRGSPGFFLFSKSQMADRRLHGTEVRGGGGGGGEGGKKKESTGGAFELPNGSLVPRPEEIVGEGREPRREKGKEGKIGRKAEGGELLIIGFGRLPSGTRESGCEGGRGRERGFPRSWEYF